MGVKSILASSFSELLKFLPIYQVLLTGLKSRLILIIFKEFFEKPQ
tara:strand:+ start:225 stop:362 length:138 start_codon:yes stop_codon:yes gene_type:complete